MGDDFVKKISDNCVETTSEQCTSGCSDLLNKVASNEPCIKDLLKEGAKYGFSGNMTCTWRSPCNIQEIAGITCPATEPDAANYVTTFSISAACDAEKDLVGALAKVLDITFNNVQLSCDGGAALETRRLSSTNNIEAVVYSGKEEAAKIIGDKLNKADFETELKKNLPTNSKLQAADLKPKGVEAAKPAPGFVAFVAPKYTPSTGVNGFYKFSSLSGAWIIPSTDTGPGKDYLEDLVKLFITSVVIGVVLLVAYFVFLCAHSCSCCKRCCKCCSHKKAWGGAKMSHLILLGMFTITFITILTAAKGSSEFVDGLRGTASILTETAGIFRGLEENGQTFTATAQTLAVVATNAKKDFSNGGCNSDESGDTLTSLSDSFKTAADELNKEISNTPSEDLKKMADDAHDWLDTYLKPAFDAVIALFVVSVVIALIPLILKMAGIKNKKLLSLTSIMFRVAHFLLVFVLFLMVIILSVEVLMGVALSDFCYTGPLTNLQLVVNDAGSGGGAEDMLNYFMTCTNMPKSVETLYEELAKGKSYANSIGLQTRALATGNPQQCAEATLLPVYEAGGVADQTGAMFASFADALSCEKSINPLLTRIAQDEICTSTVDGLYSMWTAQVIASVFLFMTLIFAEFVRPYFHEKKEEEEEKTSPKSDPIPTDKVEEELTV